MNNTLKAFIENLFTGIEETNEIRTIKEDITTSMNDKYNDYLSSGLNENEAVGKIISEFGSLDELLEELNVNKTIKSDDIEVNTHKYDVFTLENERTKYTLYSCLIAIATLIIITTIGIVNLVSFKENQDILTVIIFFSGLIPSIALYIAGGYGLTKIPLRGKNIELTDDALKHIKFKKDENSKPFIISIILAVTFDIIAVALLSLVYSGGSFILHPVFSLVAFILIGMSVYLYIYQGTKNSYLSRRSGTKKPERDYVPNKLAEKISGALFIFATLVYLVIGFVFNGWGKAWIIFPIMGLIIGIINTLLDKN